MKLIKAWRCWYTNAAGEKHTLSYVFGHDTAKAWLEASEKHEAQQNNQYRIHHFISQETVIYCPKESLVIPAGNAWRVTERADDMEVVK